GRCRRCCASWGPTPPPACCGTPTSWRPATCTCSCPTSSCLRSRPRTSSVTSSDSPEQVPARASSPRRTFAMTIVAQDPSVGNAQGMLRATVPVPADRLEPGPRSHRFQVIDYDATARILLPPATLAPGTWQSPGSGGAEHDPFWERSDTTLLSDPACHAQNTYAIAARTLAVFESAIGRRLNWGFLGHELYL